MRGHILSTLVLILVLGAGCAGQAPPTGISETGSPAGTAVPATIGTATASLSLPAPTSSSTTPASSPTVTATPSTTAPGPTPSSGLAPTELKYRLIAQIGEPFFCDPDMYPVARVLTEEEFQRRFAEIQKDTQAYQTILLHMGFAGQVTLSPGQERQVYAEYKKLNALSLKPSGDQYQFGIRIPAGQRSGSAIEGLIDANGNISVTKRQPTFNTCPICLSANSLIATPDGEFRIQDLQKGMPIWTVDASGARRVGVILETARRELPATVTLIHLTLQDGRELVVSPGHPLTDGRIVGELAIGDTVDGARVLNVEGVPYDDNATFDILPSGETGFYWANGILLKSTLTR
jgi:hypothetical protein